MKRMQKLTAAFLCLCMLVCPLCVSVFGADADIYICTEDEGHTHTRECLGEDALAELSAVEEALLASPTVAEMQAARGTTYAIANYENDQSKAAAAYDAYVADSFAKREAAENALAALPEELSAFVSEELCARIAAPETVLNSIEYPVTKGEDGYNFQSVYSPCYEMSGNMVSSDGGASNSIPQTLILVDATEDYVWSPDSKYSFAASNYEVLYCCDFDIGYTGGIHYKRMNLEDSDYYDEAAAANIRAIVTNSYPYVSLEQMKKNLKADGFEYADELTRADVVAAVQTAIWAYANGATGLEYSQTFDVLKNGQWGSHLHDISNELFSWWEVGKRKFYKDEDIRVRQNALTEYLKGSTAMYSEKNQVIISDIEIINHAPVQEKDGYYKVAMEVELNNSGSSERDEIELCVFVDGVEAKREAVALGTDKYTFTVECRSGAEVKAVVTGSQILPAGVYFYAPEGGREISQCLVGVAYGETEVYSETSITVDIEDNNVYGDLVLQKADEESSPLTGAEFALYVEGGEGMIFVETFSSDVDGKIAIEKLLPGKYEIEETKAAEGYYKLEGRIAFDVSAKDGDVEVTASPEGVDVENGEDASLMTVKNKRIPTINDKIVIEGSKVWIDTGFEAMRPEKVTVRVMADGAEAASAEVTAESGWKWSFELPKYRADMTEIEYTVEEDAVEGYESVYEGYNIINIYIAEGSEGEDGGSSNPPDNSGSITPPEGENGGEKPVSPETGDAVNAVILLCLAGISFAVTFKVIEKRRRRG